MHKAGQVRVDITGQRFGRLVATSATTDERGRAAWVCRCDCGGSAVVPGGRLRNGAKTRCDGCHFRSPVPGMVGRTFGRLTVAGPSDADGRVDRWECLCTCGNRAVVRGSSLRCGNTRSCGCLVADAKRRAAATLREGNWQRLCADLLSEED
jgi:hypothetical protein